ncbi:gamma carbonic anhydrase family protein [Clostridium grantii]|uniref:Carbonic anhydrase or acetyltransferase, isoleucine patch superfamily n=1 Tax=Clostridium grantii DSM 8605 TaxID=1121316 RepID=A0A1M5UML5_9CLOT|nr:gamma carbonic anhydrase family protein [Clostridium grantii]SHH63953.1 Carbonic anhydrase or acetyltransferase, isoleucine patch superfamily [Clostridium grantii DSM 8605]
MIINFKDKKPNISSEAFVALTADIIGDVFIKDFSSVWFNVVIRGDIREIIVGEGSNIQDGTVIHTDKKHGVYIGENVSIGHKCLIHGCSINNNCLIGMGSIILNGASIGKNTIIGAGSLVTQNKNIPEGVLCFGSPAKIIRKLTVEEIKSIEANALEYKEIAEFYKREVENE